MKKKLEFIYQEYNKYKDPESVFVYQMGKVGSTSLEKSITNSVHLHEIFGFHLCPEVQKQRYSSFYSSLRGNLIRYVRKLGLRNNPNIKIITLVRDPLSRNISTFFQDLPHWLYKYAGDCFFDSRSEDASYLKMAFENSFNHNSCTEWFDKELGRLTGIDFSANQYSTLNGVTKLKKGKYDVLVIQSEELSKIVVQDKISEFLGKEFILKESKNKGSKKWYACLYSQFLKTYTPSDEVMNIVYKSPIIKSIYGEQKVKQFKQSWRQ